MGRERTEAGKAAKGLMELQTWSKDICMTVS